MKLIHCDSCGKSEPADKPQTQRRILTCTLVVIEDERKSVPEARLPRNSDLCDECRALMIATYFTPGEKGTLKVPTFLEPAIKKASP